jgi:hypothetical protein
MGKFTHFLPYHFWVKVTHFWYGKFWVKSPSAIVDLGIFGGVGFS